MTIGIRRKILTCVAVRLDIEIRQETSTFSVYPMKLFTQLLVAKMCRNFLIFQSEFTITTTFQQSEAAVTAILFTYPLLGN